MCYAAILYPYIVVDMDLAAFNSKLFIITVIIPQFTLSNFTYYITKLIPALGVLTRVQVAQQ